MYAARIATVNCFNKRVLRIVPKVPCFISQDTERIELADTDFGQTDFGHPHLTDFGQSDSRQTDFGQTFLTDFAQP